MPIILLDDPDSTLAMLRDSVATLGARADGAATFRRRRAAAVDLDPETWASMASDGWAGLVLPEAAGGMGLGAAELVALAEALGRALLTEPFSTLAVFPSVLLGALDADIDALAEALIGGAVLPVLWQGLRGEVRPLALADGRLTGEAHLVPGAQSAQVFLVLAEEAGEPVLVSVEAASAGLRVHSRPGIDGATLGSVVLHDAVAGPVLARGAAVTDAFDQAIRMTRLALAAELAGIASRALEITVDYTSNRVQFAKTIASFQAVQHRLVDMWAEAEFACSSVANAATLADQPAAFAQAVLAAKARAGDAATAITRKAVHLHGAMGFTDQCDIGLYLKRAIALNATLGQPEELRLAFLDAERAA